jgi:hypothetical protein
MSECDEVAATLINEAISRGCRYWSMDNFRAFVRERMQDESVQVIDNVASALFRSSSRA